jgi:cyclophilin family peptidyl-prolyl cis-trans isomerase
MIKHATTFALAAALTAACSRDDASATTGTRPAPVEQKPKEAPAAKSPLAQLDEYLASARIDKSKPDWKQHLPAPKVLAFDDRKYHWKLTTNVGELKILLHTKQTPMHCTSVVYLTTLGFYDGLIFHRVIKGRDAQSGDPTGNGSGTPGYRVPLEVTPSLKHDKRGIVSTPRLQDPNSAGSQFFILFQPQPELDGKYTVFGELVSGMDTLEAIEDVADRDPMVGKPSAEIKILKATIE